MKYAMILGLAWSALSPATASTVNIGGVFSASSGLVGVDADGMVLSAGGYYIAVGSFDTVPTIQADYSNLDATIDSMNIFASLTSPTTAGLTQGAIVGALLCLCETLV